MYVFRRPAYPILIEVDGHIIGARNKQGLERKLSRIMLTPGRVYHGADSTGEAWDLYTNGMMLSPLTLRKRATKLELIKLVNERKNKKRPDETPYSGKSLSSKTFEKVFEDLVNIVTKRIPRE